MEATKAVNLEYSISSDREEVPKVVDEIMTFLLENTPVIAFDYVFDVKVVLSELVSNAVLHGNNSDILKPVDINVIYSKGVLEFIVTDRGEEFTPENIEHEETLFCESSRGISICHILCKKLIYKFIEGKGNSARAVFILKESKGGK